MLEDVEHPEHPIIRRWPGLALVRLSALVCLCLLAPAAAFAQTTSAAPPPDAWEQARWRFGPLAMTPSVTMSNLGVDTNVFNQPEDPKQDFTVTVGPKVDWWLRAGRARLLGSDLVEGVYFATYPSQNGLNQKHSATFELPINRLRPYAGASWLTTNDRPGYEIDARARHTETGVKGGAVIRLTNIVNLDLGVTRVDYEFTGDEVFQGSSLAKQLNRRTQTYGATIRAKVTPLTTIKVSADGVTERFTQSPGRDNDGYRILGGVEMDAFALVKGNASAGYRKLDMLAPGVTDYSGPVWAADLAYTLKGMTRFGVGASRDVLFSFEITEPYYVQTGWSLSVTQVLRGPWDVQARGGWYRLAYRRALLQDVLPDSRIDHYNTWGGGIGYKVGPATRIGVNADYYRRQSSRDLRNYEGLRAGVTVTYGF